MRWIASICIYSFVQFARPAPESDRHDQKGLYNTFNSLRILHFISFWQIFREMHYHKLSFSQSLTIQRAVWSNPVACVLCI